jgi:hypothetical protein
MKMLRLVPIALFVLLIAYKATVAQISGPMFPGPGTVFGCGSPPSTNLWGWWYVNGGAYSSTSGTPTGLVTTNTTAFGTLADQSGNGNHLYQATTANKPFYYTAQINGLAAAYFNGISYLSTTSWPSGSAFSAYIVAQMNNYPTLAGLLSSNAVNGQFNIAAQSAHTGVALVTTTYGSFVSMATGSYNFINGMINGTTASSFQVNAGTPVTGALAAGSGATEVTLGTYENSNSYGWFGYIAEAILYQDTTTPAAGNGAAAAHYLNCKYNLGLPY